MKQKKFSYLLVLQGNYGEGWEDLCAEEICKDNPKACKNIRADKKAYLENDTRGIFRIIKRRELNA
jgi:hypothetical protein